MTDEGTRETLRGFILANLLPGGDPDTLEDSTIDRVLLCFHPERARGWLRNRTAPAAAPLPTSAAPAS